MAMKEIGVLDPAEQPTGPESGDGLAKLNRMLDAWNADGRYIYASVFTNYVLTPGLQPHTIGPTGTFVVPQRPIKILNANIILNAGGPGAVRQPVNIRDEEWWANKRAYAVQGTFPTDLYFSADWPNGSLFLWVVPNTAYPLELQLITILSQLQLTDAFSLPPGYLDAVVYSLAEALCPSFGQEISPSLEKLKMDAVRRIQSPNLQAPRMETQDWGMPRGEERRASFNYKTGSTR